MVPIRHTAQRILESIVKFIFKIIYLTNYRKQAAVCSECNEHILPGPGETQAVRIRALGRNFHTYCFKCKVSERNTTKENKEEEKQIFRSAGSNLTLTYPVQNAILSRMNLTVFHAIGKVLQSKVLYTI